MWWLVAGLCVALALTALWGWRLRRQLSSVQVVVPQPALPELTASLPLLQTIGTTLVDGLLLVGPDRHIVFANQVLSEMLEQPPERLVGASLITALRDYHVDAMVERSLLRDEGQSITFQPILSQRRYILHCQPLLAPLEGAVVVVHDLTQIANLERARREMVSNVSHELRTPLTSIRLLVETLASEPPPDPERARRMLGLIDDETQAMTQLIDELRELVDIESGRVALQLQPMQVADLVGRAVERLQPQAERRGLHLTTELTPELPPVLVDADRIGQVLINLLHNALKFTPEHGNICIRAFLAAPPPTPRVARELKQVEGDDWLVVSVSDTGIGIPAAEIERVFERFYKVDRARTRNSGGTGLGLAIAKHLVERHGGRVWAESVEGRGSTFSLLLPLA